MLLFPFWQSMIQGRTMVQKFGVSTSFEAVGAFWPYGETDKRFTGNLSSDKGRLLLKAAPVYTAMNVNDAAHEFFVCLAPGGTDQRLKSMTGYTSEGKCTLLSCLPLQDGGITDLSTGQRIAMKQFRPSAAVMGIQLQSAETNQIHSTTYHFTKIQNWFPTALSIRWEEDSRGFVVPTKELEVFRFKCRELGAEIICEVRARGGVRAGRTAKIKSDVQVRIIPDELKSLNWFNEVGSRLENFFALCIGTSVSLKTMELIEGEETGFFVRGLRRRKEKTNIQMWIRCPSSVLSTALDCWLSVPKEKRPVERTLLGMLRRSRLFLETEFLSLAQALEGFHRIHVNPADRHFAERIADTYQMLSPNFALKLIGDKQLFIRTVVDTRNLYTHLGIPAGIAAQEDSEQIFYLNQRLNALLRCVMLIDLGFDESYLRDPILYQATRWQLT